jgi:hypothetical protein
VSPMLRPALRALFAAFLLPAGLPAQAGFEGVITYRIQVEGMNLDMRLLTKGLKTRMEMQMPDMPGEFFMLMDMESGVMQTVMPAMGMYMEMSFAEVAKAAEEDVPTFRTLGTTDEVAGIRCENYRFGPADNEEVEACLATGMGWFMPTGPGPGGPGGGGGGPDLAAYREAFKDGALPLRVRSLEGGTWQVQMEATGLERKALDDRLFKLPAGLQKISMPGGE